MFFTPSVFASNNTGARLVAGPIPFPSGFMISIKTYGAVGDGVTDDTAAIQAALSDGRPSATQDYNGLPKALYFPPGTYLVSNTLSWNGCCVTLQGDGSSTSVIRLAPSSAGFGDPSKPKSVVKTAATNTNESFRQNIWDIGITVGSKNSGAMALSYVSNNIGSIHNVVLKSEDGHGVSGLDLTRVIPGPMMVKDLLINGFEYGIQTCNCFEYSATFEEITLENQTTAAISDWHEPLSINNLRSINNVPVLLDNGASTVILNAWFTGGSKNEQAIVSNGALYLRNIVSSGYGETVSQTNGKTVSITKGNIVEYTAQAPERLLSTAPAGSLKLPIQDTPTFTVNNPTDSWVAFVPRWYGDVAGLQAVFNAGKATVYFPFGRYVSYNEVSINVPDNVDHVVGFSSIVNMCATCTGGGGINLVINGDTSTPLIIEEFGYGIKVEHHGTRPVVLKDGRYNYISFPGAGNLFLEDVGMPQTMLIQAGQRVWARQFNDEVSTTKLINNGTLWILGIKTEQAGTVINTQSGGETELLGGLIYPATVVPSNDIAFDSTDASVSYVYAQSAYCTTCGYTVPVSQTYQGVTSDLTVKPNAHFVMPLFVGTNEY